MATEKPKSKEALLKSLSLDKATKVKVAITDMDGILRGKYLHIDKFASAAQSGFGFCNVVFGWDAHDQVYDNVSYTNWNTGYPDALATVDLATQRYIPWDECVPFFLADFIKADGAPLEICPRQVLKRVIAQAKSMGFDPMFGVEFEWFNFRETPFSLQDKKYVQPTPLTPGMFGYSLLRSTLDQPFFREIIDKLRDFRVPIEGLHTETGPGVFEAAIQFSDALEAADRAVLFKTSVKELAYPHGIMPTFMAKWNAKLAGCSGHLHQSLVNLKGGLNAFYSDKDTYHMSDTFKSYLAGQMHCFPEILPLAAPTINSYKRLVEGHWAPTRITWGVDNRTSSFRVISGSKTSTRLETRVTGSDINPYLGIAAALASGLYGIEKGLKLKDPPVTGNAYKADGAVKLPRNLFEATEKFNHSKIARELFGDTFVDHFAQTRYWEWKQFQEAVTSWEMERYFEII